MSIPFAEHRNGADDAPGTGVPPMTDTAATTAAPAEATSPAESNPATSEATPPSGAALDPAAETPTDEQCEPADDTGTDDLARWKRRARDWERRAKRNSDLAARYPDLEARARSLEEQYEEALGARTRAEAELWRERAARAHGVPEEFFEFLTGSSETEVMERAERIAAKLTGPRRPLPAPQGRGTSAPASPADAFAAYVRDSLNK